MRYRLKSPSGPIRQVVLKTTPGHLRIDLQERPGLDVDPPLPRLRDVAVGVLVGDRHGEPVDQLVDRLVDRRGVGELGEDDELDVEERLVADDRAVDHPEQAPDPRGDRVAVARARQIGLAGGGVVSSESRSWKLTSDGDGPGRTVIGSNRSASPSGSAPAWLMAMRKAARATSGLRLGSLRRRKTSAALVVRPERNHSAPRTSQASRSSGWAWT